MNIQLAIVEMFSKVLHHNRIRQTTKKNRIGKWKDKGELIISAL